jgi:hypothetical protein
MSSEKKLNIAATMYWFPMFSNFLMSSMNTFGKVMLIPLSLFGYTLHVVTQPTTVTTICKSIKCSSMRNEEGEPMDFFVGKYYCGYISGMNHEKVLYCLCTDNQFREFKKNNDIIIEETDDIIQLYTRSGTYFYFEYTKRDLVCTHFSPREKQKKIMEKIIKHYKETNVCVAMISGKPGTGKSLIGFLLAKEFKSSFCKTYNPSNPRDTLENLYTKVNPTFDKPLIILLDEVDVIFKAIEDGTIQHHKTSPTEVYNKTTWNSLLDDINFPLHPFVILILTTNLSKKKVMEEYDKSYTRMGRINVYAKLK